MPKRMLIDASHPEETRVVVLDGQKVDEFDFEAAAKRPLKGNIYLAKVTRVEPSLQAAFVEYGGNRQGFLAFSEIHPDYYQIPIADRQALLAEQEAEARRRSEDEFEAVETAKTRRRSEPSAEATDEDASEAPLAAFDEDGADDAELELESDDDTSGDLPDAAADDADGHEAPMELAGDDDALAESTRDSASSDDSSATGVAAARPSQRWVRKRHYKIQEVIKRRQVMLIQVVKEERGNKGAALTTYLSLAGRYCVLMPNTPRGGGISRKITNAIDRKRLKSAAASLELPEGMGLIIRTAGANRTKLEIKRDYEYLLRMWDAVRELTLKSNAPACVYEEGDLIKRAIRDLYNKDVSEVIVEGEEGYRNAKDFMRMLMPSHAKNVKQYKDSVPLFHRHHIEAQLDAMFSNTVTLKSGGYIVINQTEALVAIDVNSGRATREHNIEDTAYKTNLEAAEEISRQLRLRDLAGLIVIDFIDMEDARNDRNVEKRLRDCVKNDRARVQIGKISQFGLLEMSRQRLRAGVIAGSTVPCPVCAGQGIVRSVESTALRVLRGLEEEGQKLRAAALTIRVPADVAVYTLNQKRRELMRIETDYQVAITFEPDNHVTPGNFEIERTQLRAVDERERAARAPGSESVAIEEAHVEEVTGEEIRAEQPTAEGAGGRRRRRRRRGRDRAEHAAVPAEGVSEEIGPDSEGDGEPEAAEGQADSGAIAVSGEEGTGRRKRRRRRRGRRGRREQQGESETEGTAAEAGGFAAQSSSEPEETAAAGEPFEANVEHAPVQPVFGLDVAPNAASTPQWSLTPQEAPRPAEVSEVTRPLEAPIQDMSVPDAPAPADEASPTAAAPVAASLVPEPVTKPAEPPRKGWWQRPFLNREG
ncbi:MAG: Rne/Rng family ribonuclease [Alphaproteobacteria bacterium]|nr:Rne/Rng family ribonuclease [Alphaproteobacteria bacterium]